MARIKYAPGIDPLLNKHFGYTFQPNNYGQSMFPASRSARFRRPRQHSRQQNNQKAVRQWRNLSAPSKAAWNLFASTYVQSTKRGVGTYLTGYQLFIKRNSYCFLNHGITSEFMLEPAMEAIEAGTTLFELTAGDNTIDLTELYISNFGIIPSVGQTLLFCAIPYSDVSGQFFAPVFEVLSVIDVYFDGFFLNLSIPPQSNNILYSVYLSKPVSAGMSYVGTKVRYMGCFTTKKFTALSDVPAVTPADAGKVWTVDVNGLWTVAPASGGGGLTCEDLPACPTIISLQTSINQISEILVVQNDISIPEVHYGLLYNGYTAKSSLLGSTSEWNCPTYNQWLALQSYLSSNGYTGNDLKESGLTYWLNNIGLNTCKFFARGAGSLNVFGVFEILNRYNQWWASDYIPNPTRMYAFYVYTSNYTFSYLSASTQWNRGYSIRLCRPAVGIPNFTIGSYIGNNNRVYRTTVINEMEYTADNLAETLLRDGSTIPYYEDTASFGLQTSPASIAPLLDWNNV